MQILKEVKIGIILNLESGFFRVISLLHKISDAKLESD
jgi:hypothetical protein